MIKVRADELESKHTAIHFLSLLEQAGVLETTWETHDGRMDKVWFYDSSKQSIRSEKDEIPT